MPGIPDFPGKGLIEGTTKRARVLAGVAGAGALTVGGMVAKRALGHVSRDDAKPDADPIAQTPTAPPGAEEKPVPKARPAKAAKPLTATTAPKVAKPEPATPEADKPKPKPAKPKTDKPKPGSPQPKTDKPKPKPAKPKADKPKPKPAKPKADKPKSAKAKAARKPKPPAPTGTDAPAKPASEPGNISTDREHPHRALNNPVDDPDETEYPDPFEKRSDPRDPVDPDGEPFGQEPHPQVGSESTSEPPLSQDPALEDGGKPPRREKLDD